MRRGKNWHKNTPDHTGYGWLYSPFPSFCSPIAILAQSLGLSTCHTQHLSLSASGRSRRIICTSPISINVASTPGSCRLAILSRSCVASDLFIKSPFLCKCSQLGYTIFVAYSACQPHTVEARAGSSNLFDLLQFVNF